MKGSLHSFDWDAANTKKCEKHGVSIAEVEFLFMHTPTVYPDPRHSGEEIRHIAIGRNGTGRYIFVAFTYRQRGVMTIIRPISARYMHQKEIRHYLSYEKET